MKVGRGSGKTGGGLQTEERTGPGSFTEKTAITARGRGGENVVLLGRRGWWGRKTKYAVNK